MQIEAHTPHGVFKSQRGTLRSLEHTMGAIHIVDDLFTQDFVVNLWQLLRSLPYVADDYDTEDTKQVLHMKCELPAQPLLSAAADNPALKFSGAHYLSAVAGVILEIIKRMYIDYRDISIHRIHVNCIPYGDYLSNHKDGEPGLSLTGLYYGNAQWLQQWGGEFIICDSRGESLYAVEPKPGRLVLFPGGILHRAGAPSRACYMHRLTIGHKFSASKRA